MSPRDFNYHIMFTMTALILGILGKAVYGLSFTTLATVSIAFGLIVCLIAVHFGVKGYHKMYQHGVIREDGTIDPIEINIPLYKDWYSPVLIAQAAYFPLNTGLGALLGLLILAH